MNDPFDGTWTIDLTHSFVWDDTLQKHVPDEVGQEVITLRTVDRVQSFEVLYGDSPQIRMAYTAAYDGAEWVPYVVKEIVARSGNLEAEVADFKRRIKSSSGERDRTFEVGRPYGLVRVVYVDARTQYRINKSADSSTAQSILLRRLAEDGASYLSTVLDANGVVHRIRKFVRI